MVKRVRAALASTCWASPADLATTPRGCSAGANIVILAGMKHTPAAPTLEQLRRGHPWCWVVCERCLHRRPVAFVPLIIPEFRGHRREAARFAWVLKKGHEWSHREWPARQNSPLADGRSARLTRDPGRALGRATQSRHLVQFRVSGAGSRRESVPHLLRDDAHTAEEQSSRLPRG